MLGFFLKEISAIVRAICRSARDSLPRLCNHPSLSRTSAEATLLRSQRLGLGRGEPFPRRQRCLFRTNPGSSPEPVRSHPRRRGSKLWLEIKGPRRRRISVGRVYDLGLGWSRLSADRFFAGSPALSQRPPARLETRQIRVIFEQPA
ncbi:hypothetical protein F4774DRAFT_278865 [Daldinia eschscholtzii]|nr:hypothetical protein F4774DRAFT_278865 [Daldinia eschscholtzii]